MIIDSNTGKIVVPLEAAQIPTPPAAHPVGFPATRVERMLALEFRLWFSSRGPVRLEDMTREHIAAARVRMRIAAGRTSNLDNAQYYLAWCRLFRAELARRDAGAPP